MLKLALRGLAARKLRAILSAIAIVLGVGMVASSFVVTDRIFRAFDDIFASANAGVDVVLTRKTEFKLDGGITPPLEESVLAEVRKVPGVEIAAGAVASTGSIIVDGEFVETLGGPALVFSTVPEPFNPNTATAGRLPEQQGEIAVDKDLADREDLTVGQKLGLQTPGGVRDVTLSGIFKFADASIGGATLVATTLPDAQAWFDRAGQLSLINVSAVDGVTPSELKSRLEAALPATVKVATGAEDAQEQADTINDEIGSFLRPALLAFGGIAILVGIFSIFNTFSITVSQRTRELAMLRTIGATRGQLVKSLLIEALVMGVLASIVGVAAGVGLALLIGWLFEAVGFGLPQAGIVLSGRTIAIAMAVGVISTLLAALIPALRATRVAPVAALREGAVLAPSRFARYSPFLAALAAALGIFLLVDGLFLSEGGVTRRLFPVILGAVVLFVAVGMLSRYFIRPLARLVGAPLRGTTGRIAQGNATRNPGRTAATAAALMIGVALVVFVGIFAQGLKETFTRAIDRSIKSDLIVTSQSQNESLTPAAVDAAATVEGVDVAPAYFGFFNIAKLAGKDVSPAAVNTDAAAVYKFDWEGGASDALIARLTGPGAILERDFARDKGLEVGERFTLQGPTASVDLQVLGTYTDPQLFNQLVIGVDAYDRLFVDRELGLLAIADRDGEDEAASAASVTEALKAVPSAKVQSNAEFKKEIESNINQLLFLLYALLAISVVISIFGIVATLVLSVYERTREIGMMRAIGTTRRQIRSIVRKESVITAAIGGVLGIALGLVLGWLMAKALEGEGLVFTVPVGLLITVLIVSALVGVVAAILPARRAARLNILDALHYE